MLTRLGLAAAALAARSPFTDVVGLARTLLALATAATLAASDPATLFHPEAGGGPGPRCEWPAGLAVHCLLAPDHLELARWLSVVALLVVASGWRPRLTALPHWWLTWSLSVSATLTDGGDQVAAVLTLLLVPVGLLDGRRWHWLDDDSGPREQARIVAFSVLWVVRLQVAGIYLHAAIAKLGRPEWADGTALYYWLGNPVFGLAPWLRPLAEPLLAGPAVAVATWGVLVLEVLLGAALIASPAWRRWLLPVGIAFHLGIAQMGLASFAVVMCAALLLFLRPVDAPLQLAARALALRDRVVAAARPARPAPAPAASGGALGDHRV